MSVIGLRTSMLAGGVGDRAHIPQERGGARLWAFARGWRRIEVAKAKVVGKRMSGGRTNINRDGVDLSFKLRSPTKIALDIATTSFDKKKENWNLL